MLSYFRSLIILATEKNSSEEGYSMLTQQQGRERHPSKREIIRCRTKCCVMMQTRKTQKPVQTGLWHLLASHHYTKIDMASYTDKSGVWRIFGGRFCTSV